MNGIVAVITDKDDKKAYDNVKKIATAFEASPVYYHCLDDFASLLADKNSYVRTRAFILCCSQARWDTEGKTGSILPEMLKLFHDPKPRVVRQALKAICEVAVFRPELCGRIREELAAIDVSGYKDSMAPLILWDIETLYALTDEAEVSEK